jgi:hypothetical protein
MDAPARAIPAQPSQGVRMADTPASMPGGGNWDVGISTGADSPAPTPKPATTPAHATREQRDLPLASPKSVRATNSSRTLRDTTSIPRLRRILSEQAEVSEKPSSRIRCQRFLLAAFQKLAVFDLYGDIHRSDPGKYADNSVSRRLSALDNN